MTSDDDDGAYMNMFIYIIGVARWKKEISTVKYIPFSRQLNADIYMYTHTDNVL